MSALTWSHAWRKSARDFWSSEDPASHFSTSVTEGVADRIAVVVRHVDERLGHPPGFTVVDIGCGDGRLLSLVRDRCGDRAEWMRWIGIDVRPVRVPGVEAIVAEAPAELAISPVHGLVMAHEWLDEIPCDVVERDGEGVDRLVLVERDGTEVQGPPLSDEDACAALGVDARETTEWLDRWWPLAEPGDRAEVGLPRDRAWTWMRGLVDTGTLLATDYGHVRQGREGRHRHGTLAAYRAGRLARPAADGSVNLTAHVAVDSLAAALPGTRVTTQREEIAVGPLGDDARAVEIERYFASLRLRDPGRLGGISWLRWDADRNAPLSASTLPMW
jgi:SAM-dependent MidA family methyltransferase